MLVKSPSIAILFDAGYLHRRNSLSFCIVLIVSDRVMSLIEDSFNVFVVLVDMDTYPSLYHRQRSASTRRVPSYHELGMIEMQMTTVEQASHKLTGDLLDLVSRKV